MVRIVAALFGVLAAVSHVRAVSKGTTNVTCSADYDWATNSFNQNPCLVAAILVAAPTCYDDEYNIPTLPGDNYYSNAGLQVPCVCNDAVYSLFAACADCQGHIFVNFTSWTDGCNSTFQTYQGTVPPTTTIPPWATLNVEKGVGTYDPAAAKSFAQSLASASSSLSRAAASSASVASQSLASVASVASVSAAEHSTTLSSLSQSSFAPKTGTSSISGLSTPTAGADHADPTSNDSGGGGGGGKKKSDAGAIAGGVVGGIAALALLALGALWLRKRSTSHAPAGASTADAVPQMAPYAPSTHMSRIDTPFTGASSPPPAPQRLYDPADPSTFPPAAGVGPYGGTQTASYASNPFHSPVASPSVPSSMYTQAARPYSAAGHSGYTGAPEV